jgi:Family of unknown function (DUF6085)
MDLAGYCPMGCGQTLFAADGGHITCRRLTCPRPTAVTDLLEDRETEHIVEFDPRTFTIRHPLRERIDDALLTCDLHDYVSRLDGPPVQPGRYRARSVDGSWTWEANTP